MALTLHQDPMRFRGHLEGCHAWRWENYERCSCGTALNEGHDVMGGPYRGTGDIKSPKWERFKGCYSVMQVVLPHQDRLSEYDLLPDAKRIYKLTDRKI